MVRSPQKIRNIFPNLLVILLLAFSANPATAEIYKCENAKGKIVYSDTPCHSSSTQTVTDIQINLDTNQNDLQSLDKKQSSVMRQLDSAVKSAISNEDFIRADALAATKEHHEWIAAAKKDAAQSVAGRTEADLIAEKSNSDECIQAKLNLEKEVNSSFPKSEVLAAKTSLMRASCGLSDEAQPVYTGASRYAPFLFNPYRYYSYKKLGHYPHKPRPGHPAHPTSSPHDRSIAKNRGIKNSGAKNFRGRGISSEDAPK